MRLEDVNFSRFDQEFDKEAMMRLGKAVESVAKTMRSNCPVGKITRPMYKTGPYANQPWTSRDGGRLRASIRVVRKKTKTGKIARKQNVRIYAGHPKLFGAPYYAPIVEHYTPFMRPVFHSTMNMVKTAIGAR